MQKVKIPAKSKINSLINKLPLFDKILIVSAVLGVAAFAYIFFRKSSYLTVTLRVGQESVYYSNWSPQGMDTSGTTASVEKFFYKGMTEKDGFGQTMAEVLDINSYYLIPDRITLFLKTKLKTTYSRSNNQYSYKGTPVLVGSKITLYLDTVSVEALVTEIEGISGNIEKKRILIEGRMIDQNPTFLETAGIDSYIADTIQVGDVVKDSHGNEIIKILEKTVTPATKTTTTSDGRTRLQYDPVRKDVVLKMEVTADVINGKYFIFNDIQILVDKTVPVCTQKMCFYPTITAIENVQ